MRSSITITLKPNNAWHICLWNTELCQCQYLRIRMLCSCSLMYFPVLWWQLLSTHLNKRWKLIHWAGPFPNMALSELGTTGTFWSLKHTPNKHVHRLLTFFLLRELHNAQYATNNGYFISILPSVSLSNSSSTEKDGNILTGRARGNK